MKKYLYQIDICIIIICIFVCTSYHGYSQDSTGPIRSKTFKAVVLTNKVNTGYLYQIADTSILLSDSPLKYGRSFQNGLTTIPFDKLESVKIHRKSAIGRGILIGSISGLLAGVITGLILGDDPVIPQEQDFLGLGNAFRNTAGQKAAGLGLLGAGCGAVTGLIVGLSAKKTFIIKGKKKNFDAMKVKVEAMAF